MTRVGSLRTRLVFAFVAAYVVLAVGAGWAAWGWIDASLKAQAEHSARSVGSVLAQGGFSPTPAVLDRMQVLTGYRFRLLSGPELSHPGEIQVEAGGRTVAILYHTEAYAAARRSVLIGTAAVVVAGSLLFAIVALILAARFSRPVERLAASARAIGEGDLGSPVPAVGVGEIAALARELEQMRVRLVGLDLANRRAERLATLGTFTATIAHEVRNPLSSVRLAVQLLAAKHGADPAIALIESEVERLDLVVDELLGFARGMTVERQPCDLRAVADDIVRLLGRQAAHAGVALSVAGSARVSADPRRLRQLVLNLVLNAIQAVQAGGGSEVAIAVAADGLTVSDDGPGVPESVLPRLFDAFATGRSEGTGLGLHLAQAIAQAHGATLTHRRSDGRTRFVLTGLSAA